ncbi:MAG: alpha-glucosidase [Parvibaculum sp.]
MNNKKQKAAWWQGAVVYQIYPRSYRDTNGDGIGDLKGIEEKLDYIAGLGVDAIWLSPFYPSPNRDFGYDISDYCDVATDMGTLADFDRLVEGAHERGLKLMIDQVLAHTSDEHPWFQQSQLSDNNPKADWYVWAEAKEDGTPPNNWMSAFGGPAWSWHPLRRKYYFHKFLKSQPKLNFHNPEVVEACMNVLRFWLDRGVDGFRLDVANSYVHDAALRDNPPLPLAERSFFDWAHAPRLQKHIRDANTPENEWSMKLVRKVMKEYDDRLAFGEFSEEPSMLPLYAGGPERLHTGYTFHFLEAWDFTPGMVEAYYKNTVGHIEGLFPCVTFSNHDTVRPVTRWGGGQGDDELAKLALTLLMCLRGTVLMYQGEELGLPEVDLARHEIRDPVGDLYFPWAKGRDGCRTPMPWQSEMLHAGFSKVQPWLPVPEYHRIRARDVQEQDSGSVLAHARRIVKLRKDHPALMRGEIAFRKMADPILAFERQGEGEHILCLFNLGREEQHVKLPVASDRIARELPAGTGSVRREGDDLVMGPRSAFLARL